MLTKDLEIIKGNSRTYTLNFNNASGAIDITGWKVTLVVKKSAGGLSVLTKNITVHTNAAQGITVIPILPEDTNKIASGKYIYSIIATTDKSEVFTVLGGSYKVK